MRKAFFIIAGITSVGLATAGIFLPLLPTTPFLLLAAACFLRSSERLYRWLVNHRWFGRYITNYREKRAIPLSAKIGTLLLLWITLAYTGFAVFTSTAIRLLLLLVGVGVTIHLVRLNTLGGTGASREGIGGRGDSLGGSSVNRSGDEIPGV